MVAEPRNIRGLKRLIDLKYKRDGRGTRGKPDRSAVRVKDCRAIIGHLAQMPDASKRIEEFSERYPDLPQAEIDAIVANP